MFQQLAGLIVIILLVSCNSENKNDPKSVTKQFFSAMQTANFEEAQKFATKDSKMTLQLAQMAMSFSGKNKDTLLQEISKHSLDYGEPVINGDEATIDVTVDKKQKIDFTLKKEEGLWKMALDLNTLMKMGMGKMEEKGVSQDEMEKIKKEVDELNVDSMVEVTK